ncbi:hypothetical protein VSDG_10189 [Cytospora chrysosperma]|uniref:Uncharacterized protein n=1 Tax=Cytospora chrysosperma TaxID=252740 RepID=A0A423V898_CYTCH|nr:hypothetical protein VSDG_10189 [Valsa sordida]
MPPKRAAKGSDGAAVIALVSPLLSSDFTCCWPRKINSTYGFEFKNGKILSRDDQGRNAEEKAAPRPGASDGDHREATKKSIGKAKAKGQGAAPKKRKLAALEGQGLDEANGTIGII